MESKGGRAFRETLSDSDEVLYLHKSQFRVVSATLMPWQQHMVTSKSVVLSCCNGYNYHDGQIRSGEAGLHGDSCCFHGSLVSARI